MSSQRGFTMIELLVAMVVAGLVMPVVVTSIFQIVRGTDRVNSDNVALADIDNASTWINRDLSLAQQVLDPATLNPLVDCATGTQPDIRAQWVDETGWAVEGQEGHYAEYAIDPGTTILKRNYDGTDWIVGRHVTSIAFCRELSGLIHMDIASTSSGSTPTTKSLFFYLSLRPEGT